MCMGCRHHHLHNDCQFCSSVAKQLSLNWAHKNAPLR